MAANSKWLVRRCAELKRVNAELVEELRKQRAELETALTEAQNFHNQMVDLSKLVRSLQTQLNEEKETVAFLQRQHGKTFDVAQERGVIMGALAREIERLRAKEDTV